MVGWKLKIKSNSGEEDDDAAPATADVYYDGHSLKSVEPGGFKKVLLV